MITILKQFNKQTPHSASTPMDPNGSLDLAEDRREQKLNDIKGWKPIVI